LANCLNNFGNIYNATNTNKLGENLKPFILNMFSNDFI